MYQSLSHVSRLRHLLPLGSRRESQVSSTAWREFHLSPKRREEPEAPWDGGWMSEAAPPWGAWEARGAGRWKKVEASAGRPGR